MLFSQYETAEIRIPFNSTQLSNDENPLKTVASIEHHFTKEEKSSKNLITTLFNFIGQELSKQNSDKNYRIIFKITFTF